MAFTPVSPVQQAQHPFNAQLQALLQHVQGMQDPRMFPGGVPLHHPIPGQAGGIPHGFGGPGQVPPGPGGVMTPGGGTGNVPGTPGYNPAQAGLPEINPGGPIQGYTPPPAPVAPGANDRAGDVTHMPGYAQQTNDPSLWMQRHPAAVAAGNIPGWVRNDQLSNPQEQINRAVDPGRHLHDVINFHRQNNGLPHMQPEELHGRVSALAHELLNGRKNRLQKSLNRLRPGSGGAAGRLSELMAPARTLDTPGQNYS